MMKSPKKQLNQNKKNKEINDEEQKSRKKSFSVHIKDAEGIRRLLVELINDLRKSDEGTLCQRAGKIIAATAVLHEVLKETLWKDVRELQEFAKEQKEKQGYYGGLRRT